MQRRIEEDDISPVSDGTSRRLMPIPEEETTSYYVSTDSLCGTQLTHLTSTATPNEDNEEKEHKSDSNLNDETQETDCESIKL